MLLWQVSKESSPKLFQKELDTSSSRFPINDFESGLYGVEGLLLNLLVHWAPEKTRHTSTPFLNALLLFYRDMCNKLNWLIIYSVAGR